MIDNYHDLRTFPEVLQVETMSTARRKRSQIAPERLEKMIESYGSFEVMSSLVFGFAVSVFFENIGTDSFEDYYILEIIFSNLMAIVLICNVITMVVMSITYFTVNRYMADDRNDIALNYLHLFSSYRKYSRRSFYLGLITFMVAIVIYIYPQMKLVAVVTTTGTLSIGIILVIFVIYTMLRWDNFMDPNDVRKLSFSPSFMSNSKSRKSDAVELSKLTQSQSTNLPTTATLSDAKEEEKIGEDSVGYAINKEMTINDWTFIRVVGKGKFGKVMQVRKNDDNKIYAMKVSKKKELASRKQVNHSLRTYRPYMYDNIVISMNIVILTPCYANANKISLVNHHDK